MFNPAASDTSSSATADSDCRVLPAEHPERKLFETSSGWEQTCGIETMLALAGAWHPAHQMGDTLLPRVGVSFSSMLLPASTSAVDCKSAGSMDTVADDTMLALLYENQTGPDSPWVAGNLSSLDKAPSVSSALSGLEDVVPGGRITPATDAGSRSGSEQSSHNAHTRRASPDSPPSPPPPLNAQTPNARSKPPRRRNKVDDGCRPVLIDTRVMFPCNKCDKAFGTRSHWTRHQRVHSDERPYACKFCNKMFRQAPHRDSHHRIHTNEKPFECSQCHMTFRQSGLRNQHQKRCIASSSQAPTAQSTQ